MSKAVANLTQLNETITFSAQDNGESISVKINELARGPAGAAGAAGPNSVTSATTSDGTANLSLSNVTTATATVTGTLIADHIHGNLAGSVYAHVRAGEALAKGDPVYISGSHGTGANLIAIVSKADAGDPLKMPAVGVMDAALTHNASGHMVIVGQVYDFNTAAYPVNGELYVAEGGGLTATPPLYRAQPVARVERSNTNNGAIIIKVNGLSAYSNTGNTLVRRSASGDATFSALQFPSEGIGTTELGVNNDGSLESSPSIVLPGASGTLALTNNLSGVVGIAYGGTNATTVSDARANLSLGPTGTITTSQPLSLTQTWNAAGVTFKGIDVNVTDTASASGSLLMDLRVGGTSLIKATKAGEISFASKGKITSFNDGDLDVFNNAGTRTASLGTNGIRSFVGQLLSLSTDVILVRDAANTLAQRNGANAQEFRLYNTYTSATDYHRLAIATARATATAMSGATITLTNIIPAGAVVVGVTCKVTTAITGATSFDIGTATDVDRFGAAIAVALGTTSDNRNWTAGTIECFPTATSLILTANGSNFTAGAVYVSVQYLTGQAD